MYFFVGLAVGDIRELVLQPCFVFWIAWDGCQNVIFQGGKGVDRFLVSAELDVSEDEWRGFEDVSPERDEEFGIAPCAQMVRVYAS